MAYLDVKAEAAVLGRFVRIGARTEPHRKRHAAGAPAAQNEPQPPRFQNKGHGEGERTEPLAEQPLRPAATGKLATRKRPASEASRPGLCLADRVELHADGRVGRRSGKPDKGRRNSADQAVAPGQPPP